MEKTTIDRHEPCHFRPRNAAQEEVGCPLDHCGDCGGHDDGSFHCKATLARWRHDDWHATMLYQLFDGWYLEQIENSKVSDDPVTKELLQKAFMFGVEGKDHEMHEYNLSDKGCDYECDRCHPELDEQDPMGGPGRYV